MHELAAFRWIVLQFSRRGVGTAVKRLHLGIDAAVELFMRFECDSQVRFSGRNGPFVLEKTVAVHLHIFTHLLPLLLIQRRITEQELDKSE